MLQDESRVGERPSRSVVALEVKRCAVQTACTTFGFLSPCDGRNAASHPARGIQHRSILTTIQHFLHSCHTAFPKLNDIGLAFKDAGFQFSEEDASFIATPRTLLGDIQVFLISKAITLRPTGKSR